MKKLSVVVLSAALLLTGCTTSKPTSSDISATDITLPIVHSGEVPTVQRVVALANGSAEIVAALGYQSVLVGRDVASTMPELAAIPIDNPGHNVSTETVLAQKPDLILIDANTSPTSALNTLKQSGIKIVTIPSTFDLKTVAAKERAVASAIGTPKAGELLTKQISSINNPVKPIKVVFLYLRGTSSIYLIGGKGSGADSLITAMGFTDIGAANLVQPFSAMSAEELVKLNPDVILLMTKGLESVGGLAGLVQLPGIAQTQAGQHKRVVTVDDSLLLSFGPRTIPLIPHLRDDILKASTL
jgi:iron complex transport system substrate-binding protein